MRRLTSAGRVVAALLAFASLGAALPAAAAAQVDRNGERIPDRPRLRSKADSNDWQAYYTEGVKQLKKRPERATACFYWASRLDPSVPAPIVARWVSSWREEPQLLKEYLDSAEYVVKSGRAATIDSIAYRAMLRNPLVNQQLTLWAYERVVTNWDGDPLNHAWLLYSQGKFPGALRDFATALEEPGRVWLRYERALMFEALQQHDSAALELERLVAALHRADRKRLTSVYQSTAMYEYAAGRAWVLAGRLDKARDAFGRALGEDLSFYMAHAALAELAYQQNDTALVVQEYAQAVELAPGDAALRFGFGNLLLELERYEDAVVQFRAAIEDEPYYALPYLNLAVALDKLGRSREALAPLETFVARAPARYRQQADIAATRAAQIRAESGG